MQFEVENCISSHHSKYFIISVNMSYHLEALRRSKILARKRDAQFNLAAKHATEVPIYQLLDLFNVEVELFRHLNMLYNNPTFNQHELQGAELEVHVENFCREYTFPRRVISSYEVPRFATFSDTPLGSE